MRSPIDAEIARRAARQHGVLHLTELLEAGLDARAVQYRLGVGRLQRVHRSVYGVGHAPISPVARAMAAVLACGPGAVLSHRSAGTLWGIDPRWRTPIEITTATQRRVRGVLVHRSRTLDHTQVTKHVGIPVTTPARTILDLTEVLDDDALARAVNEAQVIRRLRLADLAALLDHADGRHGATRLRPLIADSDAPTRSAFEDAFLAFVKRHGLPRPEVNRRVAGHEVDMVWRAQHLIVELDGYAFHRHRRSFERDRDRDADLVAAGYSVIRITWQRLSRQPEREARRLHGLLERAGLLSSSRG